MRLHILRHAKTDQFSKSGRDFDRTLLPKGIAQCEQLRTFFESIEGIETILCSSAARTRETLDRIGNKHLPEPIYRDDLYLASREEILHMIWEQQGNGDLLIVGHNFGISDVASYFTDEPVQLKTGGYICITFDCDSWEETSRGTGTILLQYRPKVNL